MGVVKAFAHAQRCPTSSVALATPLVYRLDYWPHLDTKGSANYNYWAQFSTVCVATIRADGLVLQADPFPFCHSGQIWDKYCANILTAIVVVA